MLSTNNMFNYHNQRILDRFVLTGQYSESEKPLLWEMLVHNPRFIDIHASLSTERKWFENYQSAHHLLSEKLNRTNPQPLAGDVVLIECANGKIYQDALIAYPPNSLNEKFVLCTQGGGRICNVNQSPIESLTLDVCGGYFMGVYPDEFMPLPTDSVERSFWFWADRACGHGGLYITRPVLRWRLKQINPDFY